MIFSGRFSKQIDMSIFDEIVIIYQSDIKQLVQFLEEHSAQKIVVKITDVNDYIERRQWEGLNLIAESHPDLKFSVCFYEQVPFRENKVFNEFKELKMPFFLGMMITNFDQLHYVCDFGVSEVYLAEDICFDLKRAKRLCQKHQVTVRTFPNVAQCSVQQRPAPLKFFIRPEDVDAYSDVIDTLEFWGEDERQFIQATIYKKRKWPGDMRIIIQGFDESIDSNCILPGFAEARKACDRKCIKGDHCSICTHLLNVAKAYKEKGLYIK